MDAALTIAGVAALPTRKLLVALAAIVLSSAVPTEPPTCWLVLTIAGVAALPTRKLLVALAAIVLSSAVPTEPPTCWLVLTIADATPALLGRTPKVALAIAGAKIRPMPTAWMIRAGRTVLT